MFIKIPFEKLIEFKTNISEITKMSLEHDYNVNEGVVLGNFYISGEYRVHEVSINKESFNYTLPFTVELPNEIIKDTLEFNIEDFTYDIVNKNSLKLNIEYSLKAELKEETPNTREELFEKVSESELSDELEYIDTFLENNDKKEEVREEIKEEKEVEEERLNAEEEKTIMDTIKSSDDTFVTYHIHIVKESETLESIATLYNVPSSLINEYNKVDNISYGDKLVIPKLDE